LGRDDWARPNYFLPEVNGYWIRAINALNRRAVITGDRIPEALAEVQPSMESAFRRVLWDGTYAPSIVEAHGGRCDGKRTSMGMIGISSAIHIFSKEEIRAAYESARRLLVNRRLVTIGTGSQGFGIMITKHSSPYLGDQDYHRSVAWPRDTPYLINMMDFLGLEGEVHDILVNTLDQSISEGALMYSSEIFGLPTGKNPSPSGCSMNLIPLKNPAQYWSHWCDPFLDRVFKIM
jgi:hypothetical protein